MKDLRISWKAIFKYGLVLSVLFTLLVLGSYIIEPMIWAADFPKEVQDQIGEIPPEAIPKGWGVFVLIMGMCIMFPVLMNKSIFEKRQKKATFLELLLNGFLLLNVMNLFDLLVVDLLIFNQIKPDFMWISGAEEYIQKFVTPQFHFLAFFKGLPWLLVTAMISAFISLVINRKIKRAKAISSN